MGRILCPESMDLWRERLGLVFALFRFVESVKPKFLLSHLTKFSSLCSEGNFSNDDKVDLNVNDEICDLSLRVDNTNKSDVIPIWLMTMFRFLVSDGLNDPNTKIRHVMLKAGLKAINIFGQVSLLLTF